MSLFKVKGWNVAAEVKPDVGNSKKNAKKEERKQQRKEKKQRSKKRKLEEKENEDQKVGEEEEKEEEEDEDEEEEEEEEEEEAQIEIEKPKKSSKSNSLAKETSSQSKLTPLQQKMMQKLSGSRFRWINEQLYTTRSEEALELIKKQPELFDAYHQGFRSQVENWPENPVDTFVNEVKFRSKRPVNAPGGLPGIVDEDSGVKTVVIADMGCGEAQFAKDVEAFAKGKGGKKQKGNDKRAKKNKLNVKVHSFDLKKVNDRITVADIKNVPLEDESCSVVIFCLALMGTNFLDFINEAYRILAPRGELWIAEIKSRFNDGKEGEDFVNALKLLGFFHKRTDSSNKMFIRFEFFKPPQEIIQERKEKLERRKKFIETENEKEQLLEKREKVAEGKWLLKPCIYKRR